MRKWWLKLAKHFTLKQHSTSHFGGLRIDHHTESLPLSGADGRVIVWGQGDACGVHQERTLAHHPVSRSVGPT
jgi:hypothetical protein